MMSTETQLAWEGTKEEQQLAAHAFEVIKRKGMLFAANTPIRMTTQAIAQALTREGGPKAGDDPAKLTKKLEAALQRNSAVFAPGNAGEFITTKSGTAPHTEKTENTHTFKERLKADATDLDPGAAREYATSLITRSANRAERSAFMEIVEDVSDVPELRTTYFTTPAFSPGIGRPTVIPAHMIPQPPVIEREEEVVPEPIVTPEPTPAPAPRVQQPAAVPTPSQTSAPAPATPAPVVPQMPSAQPAPRRAEEAAPAPVRPVETPPVEERPQPSVAPSTPSTGSVTPSTTPSSAAETQPTVSASALSEPAVTPKPAAPARPAPSPAAPPQPVITGPVEVTIPTADGGITIDLLTDLDELMADEAVFAALSEMVGATVEADTRLVSFGSDIFPEEGVERFSKGDFRRIREYLDEPETGGVASDRDIMNDVLNRRPESPDYERLRFSLNYRMLKEKKDFEFAGVNTDRLWILANTAPVVPPARKPAEIGQDYRFLEDPAIASVEEEEFAGVESGPIIYSLTYYEYENGVLPYDLRFKRLFPGAIFDDQRSSLIRFEIPALYGSLVAELRYPTGNRGGFIMGMNDLFNEHMVPGARFNIVPTDRGEDVFEIHFTRNDEQEANLLYLDERKSRYVFRPISYTVETDPAMLLTQEKFGKLQGQKKLEENERKRPDTVIVAAFEAIGEDMDGRLWAIFDDIFPVVNIERPISPSWLRTLLSGAYPFFHPDENVEGAYFYDPSRRP